MLQQKIDFTVYGQMPVQTSMEFVGKYALNNERTLLVESALRNNLIETNDDLTQLSSSEEFEFFDFVKIDATELPPMIIPLDPKGTLTIRGYMIIQIQVSNQIIKHSRSVYGLLDLFGDFGGFMEVLLLAASLFISPIAAHSFLIKAI